MYFVTHTMHTHNCMCTQHHFSAYLHCLYWPLACCCAEIASHTHFTLQLPLNFQLLSVFIRWRCMDGKLSWLRGWSSTRCSPQYPLYDFEVLLSKLIGRVTKSITQQIHLMMFIRGWYNNMFQPIPAIIRFSSERVLVFTRSMRMCNNGEIS